MENYYKILKNNIINLIIIITIFSVDRISKNIVINFDGESKLFINDFINIDLIWNTGLAFGIFSLILISIIGFSSLSFLWMQIKILLVTILTFYHFYLGACLNDLKNNIFKRSSRFFRIINEIPTILLIITVFIVIFKPI